MFRTALSAASPAKAARSQTSAAYARLRQDILGGRLAPGAKLKITELAEALEVSPGAIREALSRLVPEHLVVCRDQRGFIVACLSIDDLQDLTDLRCEIEAVALRRSVAKGGDDWEAAILASAHRLRRTPLTEGDDATLSPAWRERHAAFHSALVSACGSARLLDLHAQLHEQSERYRGLSVHLNASRDVALEHHRIVDAALDRNADALVKLAIGHMRDTAQHIVDASSDRSAALRCSRS